MTDNTARISRDDITAKFVELEGEVSTVQSDAKGKVVYVAVGLGVLVLLVVFLLGRRSGKRRSTVVEIRRV